MVRQMFEDKETKGSQNNLARSGFLRREKKDRGVVEERTARPGILDEYLV